MFRDLKLIYPEVVKMPIKFNGWKFGSFIEILTVVAKLAMVWSIRCPKGNQRIESWKSWYCIQDISMWNLWPKKWFGSESASTFVSVLRSENLLWRTLNCIIWSHVIVCIFIPWEYSLRVWNLKNVQQKGSLSSLCKIRTELKAYNLENRCERWQGF